MSLATTATQANLLKRIYGNDVAKPLYDKSKFFEKCTKDTKFVGKLREIVVNVAPTAGGSATFEDAVANQAPTTEKVFEVRRKREYSVFTIENELIQAGKSNVGAIVDAVKMQTDGARQLFFERMTRRLWAGGGGSLGTIDPAVNLATTTLTFDNRSDIIGGVNIGTRLVFAQDTGTATNPAGLRGGGAVVLQVLKVDRQSGAVTLNANLNTVPNIAVNDNIFIPGDYAAAITGMPGWCPFTAPTPGESFFNLDRTFDTTRLAGLRVPFNTDIITTLHDAGTEAALNGLSPKEFYINPLQFRSLITLLDQKVHIMDGKGVVGYKNITIYLATGPVEVIPEPYVPFGFGWLGDTSEMILASAGDNPMVLTEGMGKSGLMLLPTADAWQGRLGMYGNVHPKDRGKGPGGWVVADLAA
jgi:hypothetical protein